MDSTRHAGRHVFITGGGSGFGRATALRLANEGAAHVVLVDRLEDRLAAVRAELEPLVTGVTTVAVDLGTIDGCDEAVRRGLEGAGHVDVVISNAAAWTQEPFIDMPDASWLKVIAVNLNASFAIAQRSARAMRDRGEGGVILFTSSISSLGGSPEFSHYNATKAAIANLVKTLALELVPYRIRVNCVSPGPGDTQQSVDLVGEELMAKWRADGFPVVPLGRLASADDIAAAFSYLASDEASYVTGVNLVVDGGLTAHAYSVPGS